MNDVILFAMAWGTPVYAGLQWYTARRWEGRWRLAALAPLLVIVPILAHAAYAFAMGSNLWPIFLVSAAPPACLYLLLLMGLRAVLR